MVRQAISVPSTALACLLLSGVPTVGQERLSQDYRIKPAEVAVPDDVPLGQYRRVTQPFENWTLICDENLHAKKKVCNVSQSVVDRNDKMVFSWSLAAGEDGKPFMILRTLPDAGTATKVLLSFTGRPKPVEVKLDGCDATVCVGLVPVGPILREQIGKDATPRISYSVQGGGTVSVEAPLKGLATALAAIN